jgi:ketopantoate hydroxymethyltransferase
MRTAIEHYAAEVRGGRYPDEAHSFGMNADLLRRIESS